MRHRFAAAVSILILTLALPAAVGARDTGHAAASERASTIAYWTPERIAHAIPRDFERTGAGRFAAKGRPGGGAPAAVTGASWTGNGLVERQSGRILFSMGGSDWICSGSVIDDTSTGNGYSTVLSAGHCAFDSADGWATKWMYIPDFDDAPTYTCANSASAAGRRPVSRSIRSSSRRAGSTIRPSPSTSRSRGSGWAARASSGPTSSMPRRGAMASRRASVRLTDTLWAFGYPAAGKYHGGIAERPERVIWTPLLRP